MPGGKVTVPGTLSGHAAEIYRSAFSSAYSDTCKDRGDDRDACAAKIAWSAVKQSYKKDKKGEWVAKVIERGGPGSGHFGHAGRPNEVGGSLPSGQGGEPKTSGKGFNETIGGKSGLSKEDRARIRKNVMEPKGGTDLSKVSPEVVQNTVDALSKFDLKELRSMQDEVRRRQRAGGDLGDHYQALDDILAQAVDKREFPSQGATLGENVVGGGSAPDYSGMSLSELAGRVRRDWGSKVNFAAKPYLSAMGSLNDITDQYGLDSGQSIVAYFLSNASSWRGEEAKAVKAELKKRLKMKSVIEEESFEDAGIDIGNTPLPGSLYESPRSAGETWMAAFRVRNDQTQDLATSATFAWASLKQKYELSDSGLWVLKVVEEVDDDDYADEIQAGVTAVVDSILEQRAKGKPKSGPGSYPWDECIADQMKQYDDMEKAKKVCGSIKAGVHKYFDELDAPNFVVQRSPRPGNWNGGDIVVDGLTPDQEDALLEEGYGGVAAACPVGVDVLRWVELPFPARTVGAVIRAKRESRAYSVAVRRYVDEHGFKAEPSPSRSGEMILSGPVRVGEEGSPYLASGVLTRRTDQDATDPGSWQFRALSRGAFTGGSTALRVPPGEVRFRGPMLK